MTKMQLAIIGGGPAGLSAAIRAREEGLTDVWVIERGKNLGGILNQCIHHGFGLHIFKEELTGPEYAQRLIDRATQLGVKFALGAMVLDIDYERNLTFVSETGLATAKANAIILAMGCRERTRGALAIPGDRGVGIYTAGVAQEMVNMKGYLPGKSAVILGSGDIGLIMARRLTLEGATVEGVYEIMPHAGGLKRNIVQCLNDYNIPLHLNHTVTRAVGTKRLQGVCVAKVDEKKQPIVSTERFIPCDNLLLSVGLIPENELSKKAGIALCPTTGGAYVNNRLETNIPGIFACGNVLHVHDLVDYVTDEAYVAATNAAKYIEKRTIPIPASIPIKPQQGIRYTIPTTLIPGEKSYNISLRCDKIFSPAEIQIQADGRIVKATKKRIILPSEMQRISFELESIPDEIYVRIE